MRRSCYVKRQTVGVHLVNRMRKKSKTRACPNGNLLCAAFPDNSVFDSKSAFSTSVDKELEREDGTPAEKDCSFLADAFAASLLSAWAGDGSSLDLMSTWCIDADETDSLRLLRCGLDMFGSKVLNSHPRTRCHRVDSVPDVCLEVCRNKTALEVNTTRKEKVSGGCK